MHLKGKRIGYDRGRKCLKPGKSKGKVKLQNNVIDDRESTDSVFYLYV